MYNAEAYVYVHVLENNLRELILQTFSSEPDWWTGATVPQKVRDRAETVKTAEKTHDWLPKRGKHDVYYIGLYELFLIIQHNSQKFKTHFKDVTILRTWINECVPIRNLIAHNVKISSEDANNLKIKTKYICTQIQNGSTNA